MGWVFIDVGGSGLAIISPEDPSTYDQAFTSNPCNSPLQIILFTRIALHAMYVFSLPIGNFYLIHHRGY